MERSVKEQGEKFRRKRISCTICYKVILNRPERSKAPLEFSLLNKKGKSMIKAYSPFLKKGRGTIPVNFKETVAFYESEECLGRSRSVGHCP